MSLISCVLMDYRLLEKHKIFTALYRMSEFRSREDLMKGVIENLDYSE